MVLCIAILVSFSLVSARIILFCLLCTAFRFGYYWFSFLPLCGIERWTQVIRHRIKNLHSLRPIRIKWLLLYNKNCLKKIYTHSLLEKSALILYLIAHRTVTKKLLWFIGTLLQFPKPNNTVSKSTKTVAVGFQ